MRISSFISALLIGFVPGHTMANGFSGLYAFPDEPEAVAAPEAEAPVEVAPAAHSVLADGVPGLEGHYGEAVPALSSAPKATDDISQEAIEARDRALAALDEQDPTPCKAGTAPRQGLKSLDASLDRANASGLMGRKYQRRMIELTPDC
jgi:hypothetical protein